MFFGTSWLCCVTTFQYRNLCDDMFCGWAAAAAAVVRWMDVPAELRDCWP